MSGFALVASRALLGLQAPPVAVEVHLANGLPSFTLVGLADTEVKEARERVRSALQNSGLVFPSNRRITVNLAPADLPKDSGRFDLAIALGILAASGQIDSGRLAAYEFAGELSLAGDLRPVRGALAMAVASQLHNQQVHTQALEEANKQGTLDSTSVPGTGNIPAPVRALVLPLESAQEAALRSSVRVYGATHLLQVVTQFVSDPSVAPWQPVRVQAQVASPPYPDMVDVKGQASAKRALEIAAAGGHSILLQGSPGAGKSMLAQRFAGLLPAMSTEEALESASVHSLTGDFHIRCWGQRPTRSPHHSASAVALVGGGSPPRPGEISLAHCGVLFLDELPEFPRNALEALREPLETGHIRIARAARTALFPACFQLIAAMNPCPCGYLGSSLKSCVCRPDQIARYQAKLSGPLLDRIDIFIEVPALAPQELLAASKGDPSSAIQVRVQSAHAIALERQGFTNHRLQGEKLETHAALDAACQAFVHNAAQKLHWSARATHRVLRVARTIADLCGQNAIQIPHLAEAIQYRRGL